MIEVVQAFDRARITTLLTDDASALEAKLATTRVRFLDRASWLQPHERMAVLHKLASLVEKQRATDVRIAFVSFIGSAEVGWRLRLRAREDGAQDLPPSRCGSRRSAPRRCCRAGKQREDV